MFFKLYEEYGEPTLKFLDVTPIYFLTEKHT